jgi:hypothetical protein
MYQQQFDEYPAGPSYSDTTTDPDASWRSHQNLPYDYPAPYAIYSSGASAANVGESPTATTTGFPDYATFSPSYDYADSPFSSFDDFECGMPLSPSSSASSSSSCSDTPVTPYYQSPGGVPLPGLLFTGLDPIPGGDHCHNMTESSYADEGWEDEDATQTYCSVAMPESNVRSSVMHTEYHHPDALWASESAVAQLQYFDASPSSYFAPDPPSYASSDFPAVTSSAVSPPHAQEYPFSYPPPSCLPPAAFSCPTPLKLHQPQPKRSIPVVSLSALAFESETETAPQLSVHFERASSPPALSPLESPFWSSQAQGACMTSYLGLLSPADTLPMAAYPPRCSCRECI